MHRYCRVGGVRHRSIERSKPAIPRRVLTKMQLRIQLQGRSSVTKGKQGRVKETEGVLNGVVYSHCHGFFSVQKILRFHCFAVFFTSVLLSWPSFPMDSINISVLYFFLLIFQFCFWFLFILSGYRRRSIQQACFFLFCCYACLFHYYLFLFARF